MLLTKNNGITVNSRRFFPLWAPILLGFEKTKNRIISLWKHQQNVLFLIYHILECYMIQKHGIVDETSQCVGQRHVK